MPDATPIAALPKRRWYQYSLRTIFVVITLICVVLGLYVAPKVRRHNLVLRIEAAGGNVYYVDPAADESWIAKQLRNILPRDWIDEISMVDLAGRSANDATLAGFETLSGMKDLMVNNTGITDAGLVHFEALTGLQGLDLRNTRVTDAGLVHLRDIIGLQYLSLDRTQVSDSGLVHLKGLSSLQGLGLEGTQVTDAALVHLKSLTGLQVLTLGKTQVTAAERADLQESLPNCRIIIE